MNLNGNDGIDETNGLELNIDNHGSIEVEAALSHYRSMELVSETESEEETARIIHSRLKESYTFGAGAILRLESGSEAQTLLNAVAYYNPPIEHLFKRRYCERITEELHENTVANVVNIITPEDVNANVSVSVPNETESQEHVDVSPCSMDVGVSSQKI